MLYLLPVLLFTISFGDNECNSIVYGYSEGLTYVELAGNNISYAILFILFIYKYIMYNI